MKLFIERLARQYRGATGEKLVVTSLTRPTREQPGNASRYSVHPCGMAVDFRRPWGRKARRWLEQAGIEYTFHEVIQVWSLIVYYSVTFT